MIQSSNSLSNSESFINYFYYPASVDPEKAVYAISHQQLFCWESGRLYTMGNFRSPMIKNLQISPDGTTLSYMSQENSVGDIYAHKIGGEPERMTFFDDPMIYNIGFHNGKILFGSCKHSPFGKMNNIYTVGEDKKVELLYKGCNYVSFSAKGMIAVQRYGYGYRRWHGYKGGCAGRIAVKQNNSTFQDLVLPDNNCYSPTFIGERLFFLCDANHACIGNVYEYDFEKNIAVQRTFHSDFFVRSLSQCGDTKLIYSCGGDVYTYDTLTNVESLPLPMYGKEYTTLESNFVSMDERHTTDFDVTNDGKNICAAIRGKVIGMNRYSNGYEEYASELRYRLCVFIDQNKMVFGKDVQENTILRFYDSESLKCYRKDINPGIGLIKAMQSIGKEYIILSTYERKLFLLNIAKEEHSLHLIAQEKRFIRVMEFDVSQDKKWITYILESNEGYGSVLFVYDIANKISHKLFANGIVHHSPAFSKCGRYIYFLSTISTDGRYSGIIFNVHFQEKCKLGAICLASDAPHPFELWQDEKKEEEGGESKSEPEAEPDENKSEPESKKEETDEKEKKSQLKEIKIELDNIRVVYSSIPLGTYESVADLSGKKFLLSSLTKQDKKYSYSLSVFDLQANESTHIIDNIKSFGLSENKEWIVLMTSTNKLRVIKSDTPPSEKDHSYKNGGWCELSDHSFEVNRREEWANIIEQAWLLMKIKFWNPSELVNWDSVLERNMRLLPRIRSRRDLNHIIGEMIGAGRTSHAYVYHPGDIGNVSHIGKPTLFADFESTDNGYRLTKINEIYDEERINVSPFSMPGVNAVIGDVLTAVDGKRVAPNMPLEASLPYKDEGYMTLRFERADCSCYKAQVKVNPATKELQYYTWVERKRQYVHSVDNNIGYLHIRDMMIESLQKFQADYVGMCNKAGLIIDARNNGGGNVSSLVMQWLSNRCYAKTIVQDSVCNWPDGSNNGKIVVLVDQRCGSDGDLFALQAKIKGFKVIGKRTWGGVHGIWPELKFVDGSLITVPEFGHKSNDGIDIENVGVHPDVEIENSIEDVQNDRDVQLDYGIKCVKEMLAGEGIVEERAR